MTWWSSFDLEQARADLRQIATAGFTCVRFFLLWEAFQPEADRLNDRSLRNLESFSGVAHEERVRLQPTLFTGHMSGANWLPRFATVPAPAAHRRYPTITGERVVDAAPADFYTQEPLARAQELLATEVSRALASAPAVWSWDLGNEPSHLVDPPTREAGRRWLERMVQALRRGGSDRPITLGLHQGDLRDDHHLGPAEVARTCDYLSMHGYPLYADWARHPLDAHTLPFLVHITRWQGLDRPVLFQEFGLPVRPAGWPATGLTGGRRLFDEREGETFFRQALGLLRGEGCMGAYAWCAYDYETRLWDSPPLRDLEHERFFGIFRADHTPKASLRPWQEAAADAQLSAPASPASLDWIDCDPARFWDAPRDNLARLYARFLQTRA